MIPFTRTVVAAGCLSCISMSSWANDASSSSIDVSGQLTAVSKYVSRGLTNAPENEDLALQASLTLGYGNSSYPNLVGPNKVRIAMSAEYDKVIFAKRITRNNKTGYLDPYLTYADITSGAYDAETTTVPLPESDAQEGN